LQNQQRYDRLVAVAYHKDDLADAKNMNNDGQGFIDDDEALVRRFPPGSDVTVTPLPVAGQRLPITG